MLISQGTISWIFGYHNIAHTFFVYLAWLKLYKKHPTIEELFCIFIHDIGYCGRNYLSEKTHENHECLGAKIAGRLFGETARILCMEHRKFNGKLEIPDEYSHILMPTWIVRIQAFFEQPHRWGLMSPEQWKTYNIKRNQIRKNGGVMQGQFKDIFKKPCEKRGGHQNKKGCSLPLDSFCVGPECEILDPVNPTCPDIRCQKNYEYYS